MLNNEDLSDEVDEDISDVEVEVGDVYVDVDDVDVGGSGTIRVAVIVTSDGNT